MSVAKIQINGVDGSNDDLPINTLAQLSNHGDGSEVSYTWSIISQPPGAADALSAGNIQNPTITPKKEGSYLVQLVVDQGLATQVTDTAILGIRQLKTGLRVPAAQETTQVDASNGWAEGAGAGPFLRTVDQMLARPGWLTASADVSVTGAGQVVALSGATSIKAGLPGAETVPVVSAADPNNANIGTMRLGVVIGAVRGGAVTNGTLVWVLLLGVYQQTVHLAQGAAPPVAGDPVYLGAAGQMSLALGGPQVGTVLTAAAAGLGFWDVTVLVDNR